MEQSPPYKIDRIIPESHLETIVERLVREKLAEMLGVNATAPQTQKQWYDTEQAYRHLDLDSAEQLRIMVRDGTLRLEHEVRDVRSPGSQIPRYQFHIEKCSARLLQRPEKRRAVRLGAQKGNKKIA